MLNVYADASPV